MLAVRAGAFDNGFIAPFISGSVLQSEDRGGCVAVLALSNIAQAIFLLD